MNDGMKGLPRTGPERRMIMDYIRICKNDMSAYKYKYVNYDCTHARLVRGLYWRNRVRRYPRQTGNERQSTRFAQQCM